MTGSRLEGDGVPAGSRAADVERTRHPPIEKPEYSAESRSRAARMPAILHRYAVIIAFGGLVILFCVVEPHTFATIGTVQVLINSQATLLLLALGLTLPLVGGDFDLSVGATMGFAGTLVGDMSGSWHLDGGAAIALTLVVCLGIGMINAGAVVILRINAFIATLATSTILSGLTLYASHGGIVTTIPQALTSFGQSRIPGINIEPVAFVAFGLTLALWYVYQHTPLGRRLYFVGEGREAARLTGLPVNSLRASTFIAAALVSGIAGCLLAGELGGLDPSIGPTFLLPAYAAAFLGATMIHPGRFNAVGTLIGLYALNVGVTGLELLGVQSWVEQVFDGSVLIAAVAFARAVSAETINDP